MTIPTGAAMKGKMQKYQIKNVVSPLKGHLLGAGGGRNNAARLLMVDPLNVV